MVTHRGIEVNPNQIKAINNLQPLRNPKEVQKLTGMMATLNRFISRSAERCRPFFLLLHKWKEFEWFEECVMAFQELKQYLSHPPIMSSPVVDEVLFAYIVVALYAISLVLIRVKEVEAWVEKASQLLPFLVGSLVALVGFFGVSFGYPSLMARSLVVKVG